jgi:prepilin-type N-terminal cleavage/methylation domain-containing protein
MRRAFTLAELLIVSVLLALISAAVFSTFRAGLSVWKYVQGTDGLQYARAIQFEKLNRDVRQSFFFKDIAFFGNNSTISFPAVIRSEINAVAYRFDEKRSMLMRDRCPLPDIIEAHGDSGDFKWAAEPLLEGVQNLQFSFFYNLAPGGYQWKDEYNLTQGFPAAVRYNVTFNDNTTHNETIFLPCY